MTAFFEILRLELRRLSRTRTVWLLASACVAWMFLMPHIVKSDGTASGEHEMLVKCSLGGVFAILAICLASSGAATLAREREEKRLQLEKTRPAARISLALARMCALSLSGAAIIALCSAILAFKVDTARPCSHVLYPQMESIDIEAARMYDYYMADPETPPEIKATKRATLMRILRQGAMDHYITINTNETASWNFALDGKSSLAPLSVRLRFTNDFDLRDDVKGVFAIASSSGRIENITQAIVTVPLAAASAEQANPPQTLTFTNEGKSTLMLRPRRDIQLLVEADSFAANLVRSAIEIFAMLSAMIGFAVFLGAGLGRSVAVFTMMAFMFVSVASDDVLNQYPDQFETDKVDRIGLAITRAVDFAARPVASLRPVSALAADECIETGELAMALAVDAFMFPVLFALLSALAIELRRQE